MSEHLLTRGAYDDFLEGDNAAMSKSAKRADGSVYF